MKLYRGIKQEMRFLTKEKDNRYHELVLKYVKKGEKGFSSKEAKELQSLMRERRAYFTDKRGVAFQYVGKSGGGSVIEVDIPIKDLPKFEVEFQNYALPKKRFFVYYVNTDTLMQNWKKWKGKSHAVSFAVSFLCSYPGVCRNQRCSLPSGLSRF